MGQSVSPQPSCEQAAVVRVSVARDRGTPLCGGCADELRQYAENVAKATRDWSA